MMSGVLLLSICLSVPCLDITRERKGPGIPKLAKWKAIARVTRESILEVKRSKVKVTRLINAVTDNAPCAGRDITIFLKLTCSFVHSFIKPMYTEALCVCRRSLTASRRSVTPWLSWQTKAATCSPVSDRTTTQWLDWWRTWRTSAPRLIRWSAASDESWSTSSSRLRAQLSRWLSVCLTASTDSGLLNVFLFYFFPAYLHHHHHHIPFSSVYTCVRLNWLSVSFHHTFKHLIDWLIDWLMIYRLFDWSTVVFVR